MIFAVKKNGLQKMIKEMLVPYLIGTVRKRMAKLKGSTYFLHIFSIFSPKDTKSLKDAQKQKTMFSEMSSY